MATLIDREKTPYQWLKLEPMLSSRFFVKFLNKNLDIPGYSISKIDLPKFHDGKWQDLEITFLNFLGPNIIPQLHYMCSRYNEVYKINIEILDPVSNVVGFWELETKIKSIDFGELKYADLTTENDGILKSKAIFSIESCKCVY